MNNTDFVIPIYSEAEDMNQFDFEREFERNCKTMQITGKH